MTILSIADSNLATEPAAYPPAPEGRLLYVIGDIHGRRDLLERVFRAIDRDKARARIRDQYRAWPHDDAGSASAAFERQQEDRSNGSEDVRAPAAGAGSQDLPSFIGPDVTVDGLIEARGDVHIDGQVSGEVCANRIVLGRGSSIEGSLVAREVVVGGSMKGTVRCDDLTLRTTSNVEADVFHNSLVIEQGCQFEGRSRRLSDWFTESDRDDLSSSPAALEIYLGDYIDRGEDSRGVVDALIERAEQVDSVFLRGNHEQFLLDFLAGRFELSMWKQLGAIPTLQSYGVQAGQLSFFSSQHTLRQALDEALTERHARFFDETVPYFVSGPYLFVHAGLRPGIPLEEQQSADLMGIRRQFLEFEGDHGHIVVHGHTPVPHPEFKHNRINLDTGAYSTGRLTCLRIDRNGPELLEA